MFRYLRSFDPDRWTVGFVVVLLAGASLRLYRLGNESLWLDEIYSVLDVTTRTSQELLFLPLVKMHLPVYYLILQYWVELFGVSEASLRAPSALFGIAAIGAIYLVGTQLYDRQVGLLSAILMAFSGYQVYYSQETRMYSLFVLLTTLSFYWLLRVARRGSRRDVIGYLVTTAVLSYTHPFSGFILLAQNVYVLTAPLLGRNTPFTIPVRRWVSLQAVIGAVTAPWVLVTIHDVVSNDGSPGWINEPALVDLILLPVQYVGWGSPQVERLVGGDILPGIRLTIALLVYLCVLVGLTNRSLVKQRVTDSIPRLERHNDPGTYHGPYLLLLWATIPILVPAGLSFLLDPMLATRYTLPASGGLFILVASGVRNLRYGHLNVVIAIVLVIALLFPFLGYYTVDHRPQWDDATDHVAANAGSDDIVLLHHGPLTYIPFNYYFERNDVDTETVANTPENEEIMSTIAGEATVWVVFLESDGEHILSTVEQSHERTAHRSYSHIEVYRYELRDGERDEPG